MISMNLRLEPLTLESFSPYGDVIDSEQIGITETINYGLTKRQTRNSLVDTHANNGKTAMRLFDTKPVTLPKLSSRLLLRLKWKAWRCFCA